LNLGLKRLDVNVRKVGAEYAAAVPLDGQPVENLETAEQHRARDIGYNAYAGEVYYNLPKGQTRVLSLDRY
jgi:hypothetical protein